jgi:hypothetical protein
MPQPQPAQNVTLSLTPQQWAALQELLQHQRNPPSLFPFSAATITFDSYALLAGPIPSGTDVTQQQPFAIPYGVTFSASGGGGVFALTDFTGRSTNVVTLRNSTINPWFNETDGKIHAAFNPPVKSVSIDAYPAVGPETLGQCPKYEPYINALDSGGNQIAQATYPIPGCLNNQQNPAWGVWQTMSINRGQDDIHAVEFSVQSGTPGPHVYAVFDNLSYQR